MESHANILDIPRFNGKNYSESHVFKDKHLERVCNKLLQFLKGLRPKNNTDNASKRFSVLTAALAALFSSRVANRRPAFQIPNPSSAPFQTRQRRHASREQLQSAIPHPPPPALRHFTFPKEDMATQAARGQLKNVFPLSRPLRLLLGKPLVLTNWHHP